jgi:hypothetical protein
MSKKLLLRSNQKLWESIVNRIKSKEIAGTKANEWSARKAQMAVREYKESGGRYEGEKDKNNSLVKWTQQEWTTKSGKPSHETGERYLPKKAIENLSSKEYQETSKAKRKGMMEGKQYVSQPKTIKEKTKKFR